MSALTYCLTFSQHKWRINPVTKTGQRLYMVMSWYSMCSVQDIVLMITGPHASASLPPNHCSHPPECHNPQQPPPLSSMEHDNKDCFCSLSSIREKWRGLEPRCMLQLSWRSSSPTCRGKDQRWSIIVTTIPSFQIFLLCKGCILHLHQWPPDTGTKPDRAILNHWQCPGEHALAWHGCVRCHQNVQIQGIE